MSAPVCRIEPEFLIEQPDPRTWPSVPNAHDLPSALIAINSLRNIINQLLNLLATNNRSRPGSAGGGSGGFTTKKKPASTKVGKYTEVNRQVKTVRIYNPNDKSQFVDVEQLYSLSFQDNKTGETWQWKR